jgi:hypothetical protein
MTSAIAELTKVAEAMPPKAVRQVLDYARFIQASQPVKPGTKKPRKRAQDGDAQWERLLAEKRSRPKLAAFMAEVERDIVAGCTKPLNVDEL